MINETKTSPMKNFNAKEFSIDLLYDIIGSMIYSVGVQALSAPNNTPPGGVTGMAILINHVTDLPISALAFMINIPLLILAFIFLGRAFTAKTLKSVTALSICLEIANRVVIPFHGPDKMLTSLFAGVIQGTGLAIIFLRGSTTGGTDILSKLLQKKIPHIPMGRILFAIDGLVIAATAIVYKSVSNAMYALVIIFVSTRVIDSIIFGVDKGHMLLIITEKYNDVATMIHSELGRGSTLLDGKGTYTGSDRPVLMVAVSKQEYHYVKKLVHTLDESAFMLTLETDEVLGEGFKPLHTGDK